MAVQVGNTDSASSDTAGGAGVATIQGDVATVRQQPEDWYARRDVAAERKQIALSNCEFFN
jgi:hypothetical protein